MKTNILKSCAVIALCFCCFILFAQQSSYRASDNQKLKATTTCIVLDNEETEYNRGIKEAVEKEWKLTEYKFISSKEFEKMQFDQTKSFLLKMSITFGESQTDWLMLILGYKEKSAKVLVPDLARAPKIAGIMIDFERTNTAQNGYLMPLIKNLHRQFDDPQNNKLTGFGISGEQCNERSVEIKKKVLLVSENDLVPELKKNPAAIKQIYPHKIKVVSDQELDEAIKNNEDAFFAYCAEAGNFGHHFIINIRDGKNYFYTFKQNHSLKDSEHRKFSEKDFKAIAKAK